MILAEKQNNLDIYFCNKVKTKKVIYSLCSNIKGNIFYTIIPENTILEVYELYPEYGFDVWFGNKCVFVYFEEVEILND